MPTIEKIYPEYIHLDGGTQPRSRIDPEVCNDYAEGMKAGEPFPPTDVYFDGENYWLADGFHRLKASVFARPGEPMECNVFQGTLEDAQWHSYGVNKTHGLRRTKEDIRRLVKAALAHPNAQRVSNYELAKHCGVSESTIRRYRKRLELSTSETQMRTVTRGDTTYRQNATNIGKHSSTKPQRKRRKKGTRISADAHVPKLGHSAPCPMIPLQLSPNNPQTAAATLWQLFPRSFVETLVNDLTQRLSEKGAVT